MRAINENAKEAVKHNGTRDRVTHARRRFEMRHAETGRKITEIPGEVCGGGSADER